MKSKELRAVFLACLAPGAAALVAAKEPPAAAAAHPKIAIVIDDFGLTYPKDPPDADWMALKIPLTFADMPVSPRTERVAAQAPAAGHELIVHFPFDKYLKLSLPKDRVDPDDWRKVRALLGKAFSQIPAPKGLNNHQSLRGTMNRPMMAEFMKRIKAKGIYFIDSRVSPKTVAYEEARKAGVPAAINDIFLDGPHEAKSRRKGARALAEAIAQDKKICERRLAEVAALARRRGSAVAIGHHYYHGTYECIVEMAPRLRSEGVDLVFASQVVR